MKRKVIIVLITVISCLLAAGSGADEEPKRVMNFIAVMDLNCGKGIDAEACKALTDVIIHELVKVGTFTVIDRANRDRILAEQGFQQTGCVDESCTVEAGRLLGVGKIVVGSISKVGATYLINLQLVNVQSAAVEISASEECKCELDGLIQAVRNATRKLMGMTDDNNMDIPNELEDGEFEPSFSYLKRYHSVFSFQVFLKGGIKDTKILQVGRRDPLRNIANRAGTLFLTDNEFLMFDMEGNEKFRLKYTDISMLRIETRYKKERDARYHPLDTYVLWIYYDKYDKKYFIKIFTLPPPKSNVPPTYGDVREIAETMFEIGKKKNPNLPQVRTQ